MSKNYFSDIIKQFVKYRYPQETEKKVQEWIIDDEHSVEKEEEIHKFWESLDMDADDSIYTSLETINKKIDIKPKKDNPTQKYLLRIAAVIIPFILILGINLYFLKSSNKIITVYASYGEQKQLTLPDGSVAWINSGSTLAYPKEFGGKNRNVSLSGEAYFAVSEDKLKPFMVDTKECNIEVLGTEFNVQAYPEDSSVITSVKKGIVQLIMEDHNNQKLTANQQIIYNKYTKEYRVESIDNDNIFNWKQGELIFKKKTVPEILKILERKYNVSFEAENILLSNTKSYTISFTNQENIAQILEVLGEMIGFSFRMDNQEIKLNIKADAMGK